MNNIDFLGFLAASLTTIAFLPQLVKTWKTKSAGDVSLVMLFTFCMGVFLWLLYGIFIQSWPVITANFLTLIFNLLILSLKIRYE
ncbi:SemiSWEET transporter [Aerosakkonemataceae cyanobacterium BLCC-F154]|uniref:SemiSWEET transporter n=1 Tax=Floridaenema fluviatile BLCC-F154 TaxID=3153640 RepID=A0ABV4Y6V5_9CYAN